MDIEQLRQVAVAAKTDTFAQAARKLHVSQSTLTRSIQRVEAELGGEVFDRSGRKIVLSDLGRQLLPHIERAVNEADILVRIAREAANGARHLDIAACAPGPMWAFIPQISALYPNLQLITEIGIPDDRLIEDVREGLHDLAIVSAEPPQEFTSIPLMVEHVFVSLVQDHPLAGESSLTFSQLDGVTFLIQKHVGYWNEVLRHQLPHSTFQTNSDYVLMTKIMSESPLPHFATNMSFERVRHSDGRVLIPIVDEDARVQYHLVCLERRKQELASYLEIARQLR